MKLTNLVPYSIKSILNSIYRDFITSRLYRKIAYYPKNRNKLHQYWKSPWDGANLPQNYLMGEARSKFLVNLIKKYAKPDSRILEIGCNVGRNLNYLFRNDFKNLSGIEISDIAVKQLIESYPEMAKIINIYNFPVEKIIKKLRDGKFDIVFTMAVLEHIHVDSEWIFPEIVRITKGFLITIEDERGISWGRFPRNYKKIFQSFGMRQIEEINCDQIDGLGNYFFARVFKKRELIDA